MVIPIAQATAPPGQGDNLYTGTGTLRSYLNITASNFWQMRDGTLHGSLFTEIQPGWIGTHLPKCCKGIHPYLWRFV